MLGMLGRAGGWRLGGLLGGGMLRLGLEGGERVRMATCGGCGREMRAGNLARHQRGACRVWDPGGGGKPLTGVDGPMDGWMDTVYYPSVYKKYLSQQSDYVYKLSNLKN